MTNLVLYFQNMNGVRRKIGTGMTERDISIIIQQFLDEHHFKSYYTRTWINPDDNTEKYLDFLCKICSYEARAYDKKTIDSMVDYITEFAQGEGVQTVRTPMENCGDFLTIELNPGAEKAGLFMAHMDTVFD